MTKASTGTSLTGNAKPHGNKGKEKPAKVKFTNEVALIDMWEKRSVNSTMRSEHRRFCWERGSECFTEKGRNAASKVVDRDDAVWLSYGKERQQTCGWSVYQTTLNKHIKMQGPQPALDDDLLLLLPDPMPKESIDASSVEVLLVEKKHGLSHWQGLLDRYNRKLLKVDGSEHPCYNRWKDKYEKESLEANEASDPQLNDSFSNIGFQELPVTWPRGFKFDQPNRVLRVDFDILSPPGAKGLPDLFLKCLERDDIAVVSNGLVKVNPEYWTLDHLVRKAPSYHHHNYQGFTTENGKIVETNKGGMKFAEYSEKLKAEDIYMTDAKINQLPQLKDDFDKAMTPHGILMPGGEFCLTQHVSRVPYFPLPGWCFSNLFLFSFFFHNQDTTSMQT
jgi:hypothetical protein